MVGSSIGPGGGIARCGPIAGPAAVKDRRPPAGGEGAAPSSLTARRPRYNGKSQAIPPQPPLSSSSPRRPRPPTRETGRTGGMPALPEGEGLQKPQLRHAHHVTPGDQAVIENADLDECQRGFQVRRDSL